MWLPLLLVAVVFLIATAFATDLYSNLLRWPLLWVFPILAVLGLLGSRFFMAKQSYWKAWGASAATIAGATAFGVAGLYPRLLPSRLDPAFSLTAFNSASSTLTLKIMLGVALFFVPVVLIYQFWVYRTFAQPLRLEDLERPEAY